MFLLTPVTKSYDPEHDPNIQAPADALYASAVGYLAIPSLSGCGSGVCDLFGTAMGFIA